MECPDAAECANVVAVFALAQEGSKRMKRWYEEGEKARR
jgi:hypothetical protein